MRISDWSSDVCSSDLSSLDGAPQTAGGLQRMKAAEAVDHAGEGHLRRAIDGIDHDVGLGVDGMALLDQPVEDLVRVAALQQRPVVAPGEIGRASCRERVCQYV